MIKKIYEAPSLKVKAIQNGSILAGSNGDVNGTQGLSDGKTPGIGGQSDGSHTVGSKAFNLWDEGEE